MSALIAARTPACPPYRRAGVPDKRSPMRSPAAGLSGSPARWTPGQPSRNRSRSGPRRRRSSPVRERASGGRRAPTAPLGHQLELGGALSGQLVRMRTSSGSLARPLVQLPDANLQSALRRSNPVPTSLLLTPQRAHQASNSPPQLTRQSAMSIALPSVTPVPQHTPRGTTKPRTTEQAEPWRAARHKQTSTRRSPVSSFTRSTCERSHSTITLVPRGSKVRVIQPDVGWSPRRSLNLTVSL